MRTAGVVLGLLTLIAPITAGDRETALAIIDKAIEAQGGATELAKGPVASMKVTGKFHGLRDQPAFDFTGEFTYHGPAQARQLMDCDAGGHKFQILSVLNGNSAWLRTADGIQESPPAELLELQESTYVTYLTSLLPLKQPGFTLTPTGESRLRHGDRAALGVKVASKRHRDVTLFFYNENGLLLKSETRSKDFKGDEGTDETFFLDYKPVGKTKQPMRVVTERDGKSFMSWDVKDYRFSEKPAPGTFDKP